MSITNTAHTRASLAGSLRPSETPHPLPASHVDTSNLSPGAAARYEKLMRSIDAFTAAVRSKAITLPERK
jgi:hypothetical protein